MAFCKKKHEKNNGLTLKKCIGKILKGGQMVYEFI